LVQPFARLSQLVRVSPVDKPLHLLGGERFALRLLEQDIQQDRSKRHHLSHDRMGFAPGSVQLLRLAVRTGQHYFAAPFPQGLRNKEIDLTPGFQRKGGIWSKKAKSQLIESLLIRIPLQLQSAKSDVKRTSKQIVDLTKKAERILGKAPAKDAAAKLERIAAELRDAEADCELKEAQRDAATKGGSECERPAR
jgi:hypothetical protein